MSVNEYVGRVLLYLGITMRYKGYGQTICAVEIAVEDPESLTLVSKRLYPGVGKSFGVSWRVAERNIRTVVEHVWELNPDGLSRIAGRELRRKPTVSDFIAIIVNDVNSHLGVVGQEADSLSLPKSESIQP